MDYSVCTWAEADLPARAAFLQQYYAWKAAPPVISTFLLCLLLLLPMVFYSMVKEDVLGLFDASKAAARRRHAWGAAHFFGIIGIIAYVVSVIKPAEAAVMGAAASSAALPGLVAAARLCHAGHALGSVALGIIPLFKYSAAAAAGGAGAGGGAAESVAAKPPTSSRSSSKKKST